MAHTTQMDAARRNRVTPEMIRVAEKENISPDDLRDRIAKGEVIIPANHLHRSLNPEGIGNRMRTKINVNLGVSEDCRDMEMEMRKVRKAIELKAEAIMDLSCYGKTGEFRKRLVETSPAMIGTVPIYDAVGFHNKELRDITVDDFFHVVETHARDGVDFMTIHAGLNLSAAARLKAGKRLTQIVSRGGSLIYCWMAMNNRENPFYEHFDRLLDICRTYDVTISLGDACRPGSIHDSTDSCQVDELITLGELTLRAWEADVQVMIEGPGHMALNEIAGNMMMQKRLCHGAPFYVLGPLVTDIAPGYDHITSAIGGAIAASNGADFLCYVTPAEHLCLPDLEDMKEGIMAARIAAHTADIVKGIPGAREWDNDMSKARSALDWEKMFSLALDPEKARAYREQSPPVHSDSCSMCGKMCAVRNMNRILEGKDVRLANG